MQGNFANCPECDGPLAAVRAIGPHLLLAPSRGCCSGNKAAKAF